MPRYAAARLILSLLILFVSVQTLAQEPGETDAISQDSRPWEISILFAKTSGGPAQDLEAAMTSSGLNEYYPGFLRGILVPPQQYPYSETGFATSQFSAALNVRYSQGDLFFGGIISRSEMGKTAGYKSPFHFIDLEYTAVVVAPTVGIRLAEVLRLGVGPALCFCSCEAHSASDNLGSTTETKLGLIFDAGLVFPAKSRFFVDLAFQYRLVGDATVGPFQDVYGSDVATFPATDATFNHLLIGLGVGIRF